MRSRSKRRSSRPCSSPALHGEAAAELQGLEERLFAIGYQNPIHQHAWDFQDAALAYKAFLGGRLNDDGVQLKWVAPSELLVELGSELGRGRSFPATDPNKNGAGAWTLFGHVGGDFGASTAWRAGL